MKNKIFMDGELIGSFVEIVGSTNKSLIGLSGKIIDETLNIIELEDHKKIAKNQAIFRLNNGLIIDGKLIVGRPEDRAK